MFGKRRIDRDSGGFRATQDLRRSITAKKTQKTNAARGASRVATSKPVIDARQKLEQGKLKTHAAPKPVRKQKEQKGNAQSRKRSLDFSDGSLKVTTREEIRSATVSGGSIQVVAKVGAVTPVDLSDEEADFFPPGKSRKTNKPMTSNLKITTKNPSWREHSLEKYLDISSILPETDDFDVIDEVEERLRSRGSYRPKVVPQKAPTTKLTITNLHPFVSQQDIEELFGVVGQLESCKLIHPGAAEVVYMSEEDAHTAHVRYHKRKLDGQPMLCKLGSATAGAIDSKVDQTTLARSLRPLRSAPQTSTPRAPSNKGPLTDHSSRPVVFKVRI